MAKTSTGEGKAGKKKDEAKAAKPKAGLAADAARVAPSPADPPEVKAASVSPRAKKAAAEKKKAAAKPAGKKGAKKLDPRRPFEHRPAGPDLKADLRAYAVARPEGWGHEDWLAFLGHLRERGHDVADADAIGLALERERLAVVLERIAGMGPRRVQTLVERYDTWWSLSQADVDEVAALPGMNRALAEKVKQQVR